MRVGAATRRKDINIKSKYKHYMTIKERVLKFISYKGIKPSHFEKTANLSNGAVSKMGNSTKRSTLNKILKAYPEINEVWLLTGSGSMLLDDKFNVKINIDAEAESHIMQIYSIYSFMLQCNYIAKLSRSKLLCLYLHRKWQPQAYEN